MMTALSRRESNPYRPKNGSVRARTQSHQRDKQDGRQRRERGDKSAGPEKDDDSAEKSDLAHVERRETEIGEAFPHHRIAQQHDREQREITIALGKRPGRDPSLSVSVIVTPAGVDSLHPCLGGPTTMALPTLHGRRACALRLFAQSISQPIAITAPMTRTHQIGNQQGEARTEHAQRADERQCQHQRRDDGHDIDQKGKPARLGHRAASC